MVHSNLAKARTLFECSEREARPARKFAALEEAIELVDVVLEDPAIAQADYELALNLRRSYIRRLLAQLLNMKKIEFHDWFNYIQLLLIDHKDDTEGILAGNAGLKESYQSFIALWAPELIEILTEKLQRE